MIVLLDTTVLIDALRARLGRRELLADLVRSGQTLATTAINIGEVYGGMRSGEERKTQQFLDSLECYPITRETARRAGHHRSYWAQRGRTPTLADMMVAAVALEEKLTLMTDNRKDFPLPDLKFFPLP
jgi:predicted nucleic acid-binding protein